MSQPDLSRARPWEILALLPTGICCGVLTSALMNAINGWLMPSYFLDDFPLYASSFTIWALTVDAGINAELKFGVGGTFILVVGIAFISKLRCPFRFGLLTLLKAVALCVNCWAVGGCITLFLSEFPPDFFDNFFLHGDVSNNEAIWVRGSVLGVRLGFLLSLAIALISFAAKWHQLKEQNNTAIISSSSKPPSKSYNSPS